MKAGQLFRKTMPFCMAKLLLGGAMVLILGILLAICCGIGWLFGDTGLVIGFLIWCGCISAVRFVVMHYFGYLVKAGHIAVIAEAATTGQVPANQVKYGMNQVKQRFATANIYFAVDKLVSGAVKQIQKGIEKVSNFLDFIPGMDKVASLAKWFVELSLGYIDECCLGYTFYKAEQGAFQSACDGVVIYAQNIKHLLKNAAKTMLKLVLASLATLLVVFIPVGLLFRVMQWSGFIAFVLACLIAWVVKFAFLDSFILCQTMAGYMEVAPTTQITFDLYSKLSGMSKSFRELWEKGQAEGPQPAYAAPAYGAAPTYEAAPNYGAAPAYEATPTYEAAPNYGYSQEYTAAPAYETSTPAPEAYAQNTSGSKFCGQCGARIENGSSFCGSCGAKL